MAKVGRPRKQHTTAEMFDALQVHSGSPRYRPGNVEPADSFTEAELDVWDRIMASVPEDHFTPLDQDPLRRYCRLTVLSERLERSVSVLSTGKEVAFLRQTHGTLKKLSDDLGLFPANRHKMATVPTPGSKDDPKAAGILAFIPGCAQVT